MQFKMTTIVLKNIKGTNNRVYTEELHTSSMSTEASMTSLLSLLPTSTLTWDLAFLQGGSVSRDICSLKQKPLTYQKNQNSYFVVQN